MPQSLSSVYLQVVFSTKGRAPVITDIYKPELHAYLGGVLKNIGCQPLGIGGVEDHVHVLLRLGKQISISELVQKLKMNSSSWAKSHAPEFGWQSGYGAFSFAHRDVPSLQHYVNNQVEHHRTVSFQDEYRELMREAGMEWNEEYVWD